MNISDLCHGAHEVALEKGWYDPPKSFGEMILMCHTELSEAIQEYRIYGDLNSIHTVGGLAGNVPHGVPIELADLVIRVADLCQNYGIDLEDAIAKKIEYNKTRPMRHGGKAL